MSFGKTQLLFFSQPYKGDAVPLDPLPKGMIPFGIPRPLYLFIFQKMQTPLQPEERLIIILQNRCAFGRCN